MSQISVVFAAATANTYRKTFTNLSTALKTAKLNALESTMKLLTELGSNPLHLSLSKSNYKMNFHVTYSLISFMKC